jgi:uncharacterized membrane protein YozB (DUF420 family)
MATDLSTVDVTPPGGEQREDPETVAARGRRRRRLRNFAFGFLTFYILLNLTTAWMRWGRFDPEMGSQARDKAGIQLPPSEHPFYFPMLAAHVFFSSVALALVAVQIWPGLRDRFPKLHRVSGRIYIFGGVLPAALAALMVEVYWPFSVATMLSQVALALLWAGCTTYGYILRRRGEVAEHRRWMLRSAALTCIVLVEVTIDLPVQLIIATELHTRLMSNMDIYFQIKDSNENWLGLLIVILAVEGFLESERRAELRRARAEGKALAGQVNPS